MSDKIDRLLEILAEINEIYPDIDKIMVSDPDEPDYIIISSTEWLNNMTDSLGIEGLEEINADYDIINPDKKKPIQ